MTDNMFIVETRQKIIQWFNFFYVFSFIQKSILNRKFHSGFFSELGTKLLMARNRRGNRYLISKKTLAESFMRYFHWQKYSMFVVQTNIYIYYCCTQTKIISHKKLVNFTNMNNQINFKYLFFCLQMNNKVGKWRKKNLLEVFFFNSVAW